MTTLLVTGSRHYPQTELAIQGAVEDLILGEVDVLIEGGAPGVDTVYGEAASRIGITRVTVPADWERYGKRAGPIRNEEMVEMGPDRVLALPSPDSRGTWDCVRKALAAGIYVDIVPWTDWPAAE